MATQAPDVNETFSNVQPLSSAASASPSDQETFSNVQPITPQGPAQTSLTSPTGPTTIGPAPSFLERERQAGNIPEPSASAALNPLTPLKSARDLFEVLGDAYNKAVEQGTPGQEAEHPYIAKLKDLGRSAQELLFGGQAAGKPMGTSAGAADVAGNLSMAEAGPDLIEGASKAVKAYKDYKAAQAIARGETLDPFVKLLQQAIPPSRVAPWDAADVARVKPALLDLHEQETIDNPKDFMNAMTKVVDRNEDRMRAMIATDPDARINTSPLQAVRDALRNDADTTFLERGLKSLERFKLGFEREGGIVDPPLTWEQADQLRWKLNQMMAATREEHGWDDARALATDPGYAAARAAVDSLREGVYKVAEDHGFPEAADMRKTEGSAIRLREAAARQEHNAEKQVAGTAKGGVVRKAAAAGIRTAGTVGGAAAGGALGGGVGAGTGAVVGRGLVEPIARVVGGGENLTRATLIQRALDLGMDEREAAAAAKAAPSGPQLRNIMGMSPTTQAPAPPYQVAEEATQGGHAGGGVASEEELNRPGRFVKVSRSGQLTDQGKTPDFNLKPGEAGYQVKPDGTFELKAGQETPATKLGVQNYAKEVFPQATNAKNVVESAGGVFRGNRGGMVEITLPREMTESLPIQDRMKDFVSITLPEDKITPDIVKTAMDRKVTEMGGTSEKASAFSGKGSDFVSKDFLNPEDNDEMYHVTTAKDKVLDEGLKSRQETGGAGLGGGYNNQAPNKVSVTFDEAHANQIAETLKLAVRAARDEVTPREALDEFLRNHTYAFSDDTPEDVANALGAPEDVRDNWEDFDRWFDKNYDKQDAYGVVQDLDDHLSDLSSDSESPSGRVGLTASKKQMAKIDPGQIDILKVEARKGSNVKHIPDERELRFDPKDLRVIKEGNETPLEDQVEVQPAFKAGPELKLDPRHEEWGATPQGLRNHEAAHAVVGDALGLKPIEIYSHLHPTSVKSGAAAATTFTWTDFGGTEKTIPTKKLAEIYREKLLPMIVAGGMGQEVLDGLLFAENPGVTGDLRMIQRLGEQIGLTPSEIEDLTEEAKGKAKEILTRPGVPSTILSYTKDREAGLPDTHQMSKETLQNLLTDVRNAKEEPHENPGNPERVGGGNGEVRRPPESGTKSAASKTTNEEPAKVNKQTVKKVVLSAAAAKLAESRNSEPAPKAAESTEDSETEPTEEVAAKEAEPDIPTLLNKAAQDNKVPADLLHAQAVQESQLDPKAVSPKGAQGVMQLEPKTAKALGVDDPFDPTQNIPGGAAYMHELHDHFKTWDKALAAYDWGPDRVQKAVDEYGDDWLKHTPDETQKYVKTILKNRGQKQPIRDLGGHEVPGLVEQGNIDVNHRPIIWNTDENPSTIFSTTIEIGDGKYVLVPTIANGKFLTPDGKIPEGAETPWDKKTSAEKKAMLALTDAARKQYEETGQHLGIFNSEKAADAYADRTHAWMPNGGPEKVYTPYYNGESNMPLTRKEYEAELAQHK